MDVLSDFLAGSYPSGPWTSFEAVDFSDASDDPMDVRGLTVVERIELLFGPEIVMGQKNTQYWPEINKKTPSKRCFFDSVDR